MIFIYFIKNFYFFICKWKMKFNNNLFKFIHLFIT